MNDYGEYTPLNISLQNSTVGLVQLGSDVHNLYPRLSNTAARDATTGLPNVTFFSRSGEGRSPGVAKMFWLGDQLVTYDGCDGLQSAVIGAMSGGMSGWTITHTDLGGFTMLQTHGVGWKRDSTLLIRWLEVGVFLNSMYRSHEGLAPQSSAQVWDASVLPFTQKFASLFSALRPYREALFAEAESSGLPVVRHGILIDPEDPAWFNKSNVNAFSKVKCAVGHEVGLSQFFFGDEIMVAPDKEYLLVVIQAQPTE